MEQQVVRADPDKRRRFIVVMSAATLVALSLVIGVSVWLAAWADTVRTVELIGYLRLGLAIALAGCGVCLLLLAGHSALSARRVLETGQWPLPGAWVLRDQVVRRGDTARRIARWMQVAAVLMVLFAFAAGFVSLRLLLLAY